MRNHPGVRLSLPAPKALAEVAAQRFDLCLGQTNNNLANLGVWLRWTQHIPFLCVNTMHVPSFYTVMLPDRLLKSRVVNDFFGKRFMPWVERFSAEIYNLTDGLIVLSRHFEQYWRDRGVTVPIHVIPRSVDPNIFDRKSAIDPFNESAPRGARLLLVCRHSREKGIDRLLDIFAKQIVPRVPDVTLTLVGDGPDHDSFKAHAERLGVGHRTFFPGEFPVTEMADFYRHADLFVYTSLSETYGQVISEAMWCGLPVIAFRDNMGVSEQIVHDENGFLVDPDPDQMASDTCFADHVVRLLGAPLERRALAEVAQRMVRRRAHPDRCIKRYYQAFEEAQDNCRRTTQERVDRPFVPISTLFRWSWAQTVVAGLGCIRPPPVVNRHGRKQPSWRMLPGRIDIQPSTTRDLTSNIQ